MGNGSVKDLLIPILSLIICCVIGMIYTGGFFDGADLVTAFSNSDASIGLAIGSAFALVITILLYVSHKVLDFKECMNCIPEGFKAMVPAIMILTFAWTLKAMTDSLGAAEFVANLIKSSSQGMVALLPAIIFLVGGFCHRNLLGNLWYPDSDCGRRVPDHPSGVDDRGHLCLHGGRCLRRPLLPDFRYDHYGVRGSPV